VERHVTVRQVVCVEWGTMHGSEYVNRLYGMVSRHLTPPFPTRWQHLRATFGEPRVDDKRRRHLQRFVLPVRWIEEHWRE
jgi:hypothetical protein